MLQQAVVTPPAQPVPPVIVKVKIKVKPLRLLAPGLRYVIASDGAGTYRYKLALAPGQAKKLHLKKRTLAASGVRSLSAGGNTPSIKLKAKLHKAKIKPILTVNLGAGSNLRQRVSL